MYKLYHGDCLELMKDIPDNSVDCIICDPPYGIINGVTKNLKYSKVDTKWDSRLNTEELFTHYERILRVRGVCILFSQEPYTNHLRGFKQYNFPFLYPMYWIKDDFGNPFCMKVAPKSFAEDISVFKKEYDRLCVHPLRKYFSLILKEINLSKKDIQDKLTHGRISHIFGSEKFLQFRVPTEITYQELIDVFHIDKMNGFLSYEELLEIDKKYSSVFNLFGDKPYHSNVLVFPKENKNYSVHPTQKPVALLEHLIKIYTNEGDLVLDNTMGSGSTGVACMNTGRKFIGIEKDEKYFKIAEERIKEASNNLNKFME